METDDIKAMIVEFLLKDKRKMVPRSDAILAVSETVEQEKVIMAINELVKEGTIGFDRDDSNEVYLFI